MAKHYQSLSARPRAALLLLSLLSPFPFTVLAHASSVLPSPQISISDAFLPLVAPRAANEAEPPKALGNDIDDHSCGPNRPCRNGACCGESGWCGYSPKYCGTGCQSNCDAKAECGQYAAVPGSTCPLNVCCSEFGFCGTTQDFCSGGCQSNCPQPKPSVSPSNVQKRVVGYWEAWNSQHPCGTMSPGEIPVNYLTHLNIAFGYIDHGFHITNMDGLSTDVYRVVGEIKARNPALKIMIALGGWTFSDPGPWQSVFPTMVSSKENRATFINNLLSFLVEFGYDGVDFDWEYPGADDRGGSKDDAKNYSLLLEELRAAIKASGRDFLVTFTAPTSYWYLRHFDLPGMVPHVDWINLMSYDLHGLWDSSNPIGNHVLAHTNLTEIDLALDLFWRVDIKPQDIVLGLGFYGRSFHLTSPSCWKPGCLFDGPGDAGPCTGTPGILSFREIRTILEQTGAESYLDEQAAARYLVYGNGSWISFDDQVTIKAKIDFANKRGLSGLMIWAVDLDDSQLSAMRAVSDPSLVGGINAPFTLVDLDKLFPAEILPPKGAKTNYGLSTFGGSIMDPASSSFGFVLVAGDSHVITSLRKRTGEPEPFAFINCPTQMFPDDREQQYTARVACLTDDLEGCFALMERGVEGTLVEMPDNCGANKIARAISLKTSKDQTLPAELGEKSLYSEILDFTFDFNMGLMRRDSNNTSVRMDYSNVRGYWKEAVDSPGIQARDIGNHNLKNRFFSPENINWDELYQKEHGSGVTFERDDSSKVKKSLSEPLFFKTADNCPVAGSEFTEGIAAWVRGDMDVNFFYGFSMIAVVDSRGHFDVKQSHGFVKVRGTADITANVAGIGELNLVTPFSEGNVIHQDGHLLTAQGVVGFVSFQPYYSTKTSIVTKPNDPDVYYSGTVDFNGRMSARNVVDFSGVRANFPIDEKLKFDDQQDTFPKSQFEPGKDDILYDTPGSGGIISIDTALTFGLQVDYSLFDDRVHIEKNSPRMELQYDVGTVLAFGPEKKGGTSSCANYWTTTFVQQHQIHGNRIGWHTSDDDFTMHEFAAASQAPTAAQKCWASMPLRRAEPMTPADFQGNISTDSRIPEPDTALDVVPEQLHTLMERQHVSLLPGWGLPDDATPDFGFFIKEDIDRQVFLKHRPTNMGYGDSGCLGVEIDIENRPPCCGCANLAWTYAESDMADCPLCSYMGVAEWRSFIATGAHSRRDSIGGGEDVDDDNDALDENEFDRRGIGEATLSPKVVKVCGATYRPKKNARYPAFPKNPGWPWDGIENGRWDTISKYWGNSSASCTNWGASGLPSHDKTYIPRTGFTSGGWVRADYQTEHVFEGQLIGDFFDEWLDKGRIRNQLPVPAGVTGPKIPCLWTKQYIEAVPKASPWVINGRPSNFMYMLLDELGNIKHQDRLTIMQSRPNGKKGRVS
ncbi:hypothetical protein VHEMI09064 [[Torrubiella] hemipterigena]|uniref:chitinase n=1 Tax=[Torrubiella] hemipterigena TaxID=1531966 RepID=A0A0A1TQU0_9HYPO|nr:hypothetical protein VHEMI09064 [[Torrubiella] hemipterigena]